MPNQTKILLVDDHQLIIEGIRSYLKDIEGLDIHTTNSCDTAFTMLKTAIKNDPFDIVFTDLSFDDISSDTLITGGEELILAIRNEKIPVKVGVITGHSETNRIYNVIHNLKPSAYILKGKCSTSELNFAIEKMLKGEVFYTHEIHQKLLKRALVEVHMDEIAIKILKELPKHAKLGSLEGEIKKEDGTIVKIRTIENKLARLRIDFNAVNNTDLVLKAKELGILD